MSFLFAVQMHCNQQDTNFTKNEALVEEGFFGKDYDIGKNTLRRGLDSVLETSDASLP